VCMSSQVIWSPVLRGLDGWGSGRQSIGNSLRASLEVITGSG